MSDFEVVLDIERSPLGSSCGPFHEALFPTLRAAELMRCAKNDKTSVSLPNNSMAVPMRTNNLRHGKGKEGTAVWSQSYGLFRSSYEATSINTYPLMERSWIWPPGTLSLLPGRATTSITQSILSSDDGTRTTNISDIPAYSSTLAGRHTENLNLNVSHQSYSSLGLDLGSYLHERGGDLESVFDSTDYPSDELEPWSGLAPFQQPDFAHMHECDRDHIGAWAAEDEQPTRSNTVPSAIFEKSNVYENEIRNNTLPLSISSGGHHSIERPVPDYSGSFRRPSSLRTNVHKQKGMEERRLTCGKCPKRFNYPKDLSRHLSTHTDSATDSSRYFCSTPTCRWAKKGFLRKDKRDTHVKTVHDSQGRKSFSCKRKNCGEGFRSRCDLRRHEASKHSAAKTGYRCGFATCGKKDKVWTRRDNLKIHIETLHDIKDAEALIESFNIGIHNTIVTSEDIINGTSASCFFTFNSNADQ